MSNINNIEVGDHIKVRFNGERFWCKVVELHPDKIKTTIDNHLVGDHMKYGDIEWVDSGDYGPGDEHVSIDKIKEYVNEQR